MRNPDLSTLAGRIRYVRARMDRWEATLPQAVTYRVWATFHAQAFRRGEHPGEIIGEAEALIELPSVREVAKIMSRLDRPPPETEITPGYLPYKDDIDESFTE